MKVSQDYFKKRNARSPEEKASQEKKDASVEQRTTLPIEITTLDRWIIAKRMTK